MKNRPLLPVLIVLAAAALGILLFATRSPAPSPAPAELSRKPPELGSGIPAAGSPSVPNQPAEPSPAAPVAGEEPPKPAPVGSRGGHKRQPGEPLRIPAGQPIPEVFPYQKERDTIQSLASTYDARRIPEIAAFLDHADPLVREAALQGLLQLSSPEAAPVLRAAAAKAKNPEEATALREAADFLSQTGPG